MSKQGLRTRQDILDFTNGADFLSANGGGDPDEFGFRSLLQADLEQGLDLTWVPLSDLPNEARVVCPVFSGSIAPDAFDPASVEQRLGLECRVQRPLTVAVRQLESLTGETFDFVISAEIGGLNTGAALDIAAILGLRIVDADYAGRAVPEANCSFTNLAGKPVYPMTCVDLYGDVTYVKEAQNNSMAERLSKFISSASLGVVGCACQSLSGREVKEIAVPDTLSDCLAIGQAMRRAQGEQLDPVQAVIDELEQAWMLFQGTIVGREWEDREGYMWGEHEIEGDGEFSGQRLKLWFKNENHMSWLNGEPYVASPDILELVDAQTAQPLSNTHMGTGQRVAVVGVRRRPQFDTEKGLEVLGPRHWGFDVDFQPIENLVQS